MNQEGLKVSQINIYPVKSCAQISLKSGKVVDTGFEHDREWMIVGEWEIIDSIAGFITQRQFPKMALIKATPTENGIRLEAPETPAVDVPIVLQGNKIYTNVWGSFCMGIDQGPEVSDWLTRLLGKKCRLIRMPPEFKRQVKGKYQSEKKEVVSFADGFPFLVISEESLNELNSKLADKIKIDRFRPNIVISGGEAYQEDSWKKIRIGSMIFRNAKPCARCEITTVDQSTGEKGNEPLETLGTYRTKPKGVMFGQYYIHDSEGMINVGDEVEIIE